MTGGAADSVAVVPAIKASVSMVFFFIKVVWFRDEDFVTELSYVDKRESYHFHASISSCRKRRV